VTAISTYTAISINLGLQLVDILSVKVFSTLLILNKPGESFINYNAMQVYKQATISYTSRSVIIRH